ncbi:hypothetical protein AB1K64_16205, partial [Vibrio paracholerae]
MANQSVPNCLQVENQTCKREHSFFELNTRKSLQFSGLIEYTNSNVSESTAMPNNKMAAGRENFMLKGFDITKAKTQEVDTDLLKRRISTGKAIVFTGAGFSFGTTNVLNTVPPMAGALAKKLCSLAKLEESDDLIFAADVAIEYIDHDSILE